MWLPQLGPGVLDTSPVRHPCIADALPLDCPCIALASPSAHQQPTPILACFLLPLFHLLLLLWLLCPLWFSFAPLSSPSWSRCRNTGATPWRRSLPRHWPWSRHHPPAGLPFPPVCGRNRGACQLVRAVWPPRSRQRRVARTIARLKADATEEPPLAWCPNHNPCPPSGSTPVMLTYFFVRHAATLFC